MRTFHNDILDNILNEMKKQKKTQKELTDFLGITKNVFTDWKNGKNKSYMKYLPQIAIFLNVSVDHLLGTEKTTAPEERSLSEIEKELLSLTADMDEDERNAVLGYASRLLSKRKTGD